MARKVFVSYKYSDSNVESLNTYQFMFYSNPPTTVRDYVTKIENRMSNTQVAYYKGEHDGVDLSYLSEKSIWDKLKDKIYDSTVTVVLISPNMKKWGVREDYQWIPQEISYSLKKISRDGRTSDRNALLFVILPDRNGKYSYYNRTLLFNIMQKNIDNGYAEVVQWNSFMSNMDYYINRAIQKKGSVPDYMITKSI